MCRVVFFFFQAEDGIRDYKVTGVQTCALPIWRAADLSLRRGEHEPHAAAIEKRERRPGVEQVRQAERLLVERPGARHVLTHNRDLADARLREIVHAADSTRLTAGREGGKLPA